MTQITIDTSIFKAPIEYAQYCHIEFVLRKPNSSAQDTNENNVTVYYTFPNADGLSYRSIFATDRDRILYSDAFLRLAMKTQVFQAGKNDHLRTRLTHTLEVSQIARTISAALRLDNDLVEAIALGHDVGHTPFGHEGERTLDIISQNMDVYLLAIRKKGTVAKPRWKGVKGFKHNQQSVRVLNDFSNKISLTNFCMYGIRNHSKLQEKESDVSFYDYYNPICSFSDEHLNKYPSWSFEAFIVKWADEIAQRHHDVEDALRCGLLTQERICEYIEKGIERCKEKERVGDSKSIEDICNLIEKFNQLKKTSDRQSFMKVLSSLVVDTYVSCFIDVFQKTMHEISKKGITTRKEFIDNYLTLNEKEINKALLDCYRNNPISVFDDFFGKRINKIILQSFSVQRQDGKGNYIIRKLVKAYLTNPQQLPDQAIEQIFKRELPRYFITDDYNAFFGDINISKTNLPRKTSTWTLIDCRNVLQLSWKNQTLLDIIYPLVFRAIFDYISNMTDSFALKEYSELYG